MRAYRGDILCGLVSGASNVFLCNLLWFPLIFFVLLKFRTFAYIPLLLFDGQGSEPTPRVNKKKLHEWDRKRT